jgi:hypothetical protein
LNRLQSLSLQRAQKGKDEHGENGRLDELVNNDLDAVGRRERFYRGRNLTVEKLVVKVIPRLSSKVERDVDIRE